MLISRQNEIFTTWKFSKFQIFQICVRYCYKSSANDIIPHYCLKEATKIFSLKKTIQLLKIFILSEKCLSEFQKKISIFKNFHFERKVLISHQNAFCKLKLLKFCIFKFVLDMVLKVSQARLYHIPAEEKRQNI